MNPARDLDMMGQVVLSGMLEPLQAEYAARTEQNMHTRHLSRAAAAEITAKQLHALRWGNTRIGVYHLVLVGMRLAPAEPHRSAHLALARWLAQTARVPVDARDASGAQALHHALSCAPVFEPEFAQILYDAGAEVTAKDRYGCTPMHEAMQIHDGRTRASLKRHKEALEWYLAHGGNLDVRENDGRSVRDLVNDSRRIWTAAGHWDVIRELVDVVEREDRRRAALGERCCTFCGREPQGEIKLLQCSQCKAARYCSAPRRCQASDWPRHKIDCRKSKQVATSR